MSRLPTDQEIDAENRALTKWQQDNGRNPGTDDEWEAIREIAEGGEQDEAVTQAAKQVAGIAAGWHKQLVHVREKLKPQYITDLLWRAMYVTGLEMLDAGLPEDPLLFLERLQRHTSEKNLLFQINATTTNVQSHGLVEYYADIVIAAGERREFQTFGRVVDRLVTDGADVSVIEQHIDAFQKRRKPAKTIGSFSAMAKKKENQTLNPIVIDGIGREGETINIVSDSKVGKTWFVHLLALSICAGLEWLGFVLQQGKVLLLDNELHEPTLVSRIRQIARALNLDESRYADNLDVECYRGRLVDIHAVIAMLSQIPKGTYKVVILDSLYRFAPEGFNENDNAQTTAMYNLLDAAAARLGCLIICVRHSSKGSQSNKSVIDTGAGAGAQARAVDCHLVLRAHEEEGAFVMGAALRSFPRLEPRVIRFEWPLFFTASDLDPEALAPDRAKKKPKAEEASTSEPGWNTSLFAGEFLSTHPQPQETILAAAKERGLSERRAKSLLTQCASCSPPMAFQWLTSDKRQKHYACVPQTTLSIVSEVAE